MVISVVGIFILVTDKGLREFLWSDEDDFLGV